MAGKQTQGACSYCGREMTRGGMARHLRVCDKRNEAIAAAARQPGDDGPLVHLQVQDADGGQYWLHLEMDGSASLERLDSYLRAIWLECCGHLSQFSTPGWGGRTVGMKRKAADVLQPGVELVHEYDFGTTSVTVVRAVEIRHGRPTTPKPIALMARNAEPVYPCQECEAPAAALCMECICEHGKQGTLCEKHTRSHRHRNYGEPLALVNSPRVGMCGYDGPAEPPY